MQRKATFHQQHPDHLSLQLRAPQNRTHQSTLAPTAPDTTFSASWSSLLVPCLGTIFCKRDILRRRLIQVQHVVRHAESTAKSFLVLLRGWGCSRICFWTIKASLILFHCICPKWSGPPNRQSSIARTQTAINLNNNAVVLHDRLSTTKPTVHVACIQATTLLF
jgi:hypothetical protein